jgi:2-polyprenyl-6-methoxyphenol hydroxylase-like FAD-dependent oxidoreductase
MNRDNTSPTWDCIIVGAGPAGLNAALVLGRACWRVVVREPWTSAKSSILAGRPVFRTRAAIVGPSSGQRVPAWNGFGRSLQARITVVVPSRP